MKPTRAAHHSQSSMQDGTSKSKRPGRRRKEKYASLRTTEPLPEGRMRSGISPRMKERSGEGACRFVIIEELGTGASSTVYLAKDRRSGGMVAMKLAGGRRFGVCDETELALRREHLALSRIDHPEVVSLIDSGDCMGRRYNAMEYARGRILSEIIDGSDFIGPARAIPMLIGMCRGLEAIHGAGVIHHDFKPLNVIVDEGRGRAPVVKVFDLNSARFMVEDEETRAVEGKVMVTPEYLPPEYGQGSVDCRFDIYSFGVTMYEMLSGELPFFSADREGILEMHRDLPPPPLRSIKGNRMGVTERIELMVMRMLEKDPSRRYQDMGQVLSDLIGIEGSLG